jgi:2-acylglycerol O-acyltransferase 2
MLDQLHHTWWGSLLVHVVFIVSWGFGSLMMAAACAAMASYTYCLSFLIFANLVFQKADARKAWAFFCLVFYLYMGPRSLSAVGYFRYWISFWLLTGMSITAWFYNFEARPDFVKLVQDLGTGSYYTSCELTGALDDITREGTLFGFHPSGISCIGFGWNGCFSKQFRELAGLETRFLVDKVLRSDNPFLKLICDLHGGIGVLSKSNLQEEMASMRNIAFVPGGLQDATVASFGKERTCIRKRTTFIKYALEHGYKVTPVYTFGESMAYFTFSSLLDLRLWLSRTFGIQASIVLGFPLFPLLPEPSTEIRTVVGKPIQMPKIEEPSVEDIEKYHQAYCEALTDLFEQHKQAAGLGESARLEIM